MARKDVWISVVAAMATQCVCAGGFDAPLPDAERGKLEGYASRRLAKADESYVKNDYRMSSAEYEVFAREFPKSPAIPYAMFQKARSTQLDGNTDKAIREYDEMLGYFPSLTPYAELALYFIAECHLQNRDLPNAMKTWSEMASDPDYRRHSITAVAINRLAPNLMQQRKTEEALRLYRQCAVDFRSGNPQQALQAINAAVEHYIITAPNEPELRKFYRDVDSFDRAPRPQAPDADVTQDRLYWQGIWERVWAKAKTYPVPQIALKRKLLTYWAKAFEGRFPDWKEYQDQRAAFIREAAVTP